MCGFRRTYSGCKHPGVEVMEKPKIKMKWKWKGERCRMWTGAVCMTSHRSSILLNLSIFTHLPFSSIILRHIIIWRPHLNFNTHCLQFYYYFCTLVALQSFYISLAFSFILIFRNFLQPPLCKKQVCLCFLDIYVSKFTKSYLFLFFRHAINYFCV